MIRSPLSLRIHHNPETTLRDQLREAGALGMRGVVLDATGDLRPESLSETGRRELRYLLRSLELNLTALHLPTRRPFDTIDQLEDRLARADRAFDLAYQLGTQLVLVRVGAIPPEAETFRAGPFRQAITELGRKADHRGVRLALETGAEPGKDLRALLESQGQAALGASIDPGALLAQGIDPIQSVRDLGEFVLHAYARDAQAARGSLLSANPLGPGFAPGVLDWEEYLGSLEEIQYQGSMTLWPDPSRPARPQIQSVLQILERF